MKFQQKDIKSQRLAIIDIGSYKIRVAICKLKNCEIELVWYGEKRQDASNTLSWEIVNLSWVCEDIKIAIEKAETDAGFKVENIVIGTPFSELYFSAKKINYIRPFPEREIDKKELWEIMATVQNKAIKIYMKDIEKSVVYKRSDLKLTSSHIGKIKIDSQLNSKLLSQTGTNITLNITNIFMPHDKFEVLEYIAGNIWKKILKIIPAEFAITHLFEDNNNLVVIDVWNAYTSIIVKKNGNIIGSHKIALGMNDLIKNIESSTQYTHATIIEQIESEEFREMQQTFLEIFFPAISIAIEEIIGDRVCPNKFFLLWGWANSFIKEFLNEEVLTTCGIKIAGKIDILEPKWSYFKQIYSKSKASIISMMIASKNIFTEKNAPINEALRKASQQIEI